MGSIVWRQCARGPKSEEGFLQKNVFPAMITGTHPALSIAAIQPRAIRIVCATVLVVLGVQSITGCRDGSTAEPARLSPQQAAGQQTYQSHCAVCHRADSTSPLHGPGLKGIFKKKYLPSSTPANDERVRESILMGRPNMPPFNQILDDEQMKNLLAYLHTL